MAVRKLKPIEERDPYAALVMDAFDRQEQDSPASAGFLERIVMNDCELLEMAAKAAGVTLRYNYLGTQNANDPWEPLDDDGAAFRLAVRLNILSSPKFHYYLALERFGGQDRGDMEAHRRAIVRSAAEIGRSMKSAA